MDLVTTFACTRCSYQSRNFWRLIKHYERIHSNEAGFFVKCGVEKCCKTFTSIRALCSHMQSKHKAFYEENVVTPRQSSTDADIVVPVCDISDESVTEPFQPFALDSSDEIEAESSDVICTNPSADKLATDHVASLSLKLREIKKVSGSACEDVRENIATMLCASREFIHKNLLLKMQQSGAPHDVCSCVNDLLLSPVPYEKACRQLAKEYHFNKYVEDNFAFVQPVQYCLRNSNGSEVSECMQYVPLLETLQFLLQNDEIFTTVINSHQSSDGKMRDFCDGSHVRQHPLFVSDECALQIILYYDDFTTVNPLGHRANKYKIAAFYFFLGNVSPKNRSRLHAIYLSTLCFSSAVKRCGFEEILRPLVNDLHTLAHSGVTIIRDGTTMTFRGSLVAVVADNLAAHAIGGFFESFSSVYPCRFCLIRKNNIKTEFVSKPALLRTSETYNRQLTRIGKFGKLQSVYRLKRNCCLNMIPGFHVVCGLPSDVMHDIFEGVACDVIELVVKYCIDNSFITADILNCHIADFPYKGTDKANKPDVLPVPIRCRQTAAKCRCFLRLLPLMIGYKIPAHDAKWEVLLNLLDIHDIALSPTMAEHDTFLLDDAVETFLTSFTSQFPNESVKPKMHFMTHYGHHCRMYGPMQHYWSFRFEAKHGYFKDVACRIKCHKNLLYSLAKKHQHCQSYYLQSSHALLHDCDVTSSSGIQRLVCDLAGPIQIVLQSVGVSDSVFDATAVDVDGICYERNMAVITGIFNGFISFSVISRLFIVDGKLFLVGSKLENVEYHHHCHCFTGSVSDLYELLSLTDVVDPYPLPVYNSVHNSVCIVLQHNVS